MNGLICTGPQSPFQYIPIRHSTPLTILHQSALSQLHKTVSGTTKLSDVLRLLIVSHYSTVPCMIDAYRQSCTPCYAIPSLHKTFSHCSRSCPSQRNLCTVLGHNCHIYPTSCFQRNTHLLAENVPYLN